MKKQGKLYRSIIIVAIVTILILMVPFAAMQFTSQVDWDLPDFIVIGALIFGTGLSFVLLTRSAPNIVYRIAVALALGTTFLMIWANLAVGLIGSGPNPGNLMYGAVPFVVVIGTILSGFKPAGMERAMYVAALALVIHTAIALLIGMQRYPGSSVTEILAVNGFFSGLYVVSGSLFRFAAKGTLSQRVQS